MRLARVTALALSVAAIGAAPAPAFEKGAWMPAPADLSTLGFHFSAAQVTVAPDGTMISIWGGSDGGNTVIQASARAPAGPVSDPTDLSDPGGSATFPRVAIAADGTSTAVWSISRGPDTVIEASTRPPGGSFGAAVPVGSARFLAEPDVAVAPDGTTTVVWSTAPLGSPRIVQVATRPPGGAFGAPTELSAPGQDASSPLLAVAADGTATVVWNRSDGANQIVQATTRPVGGGFGAPVDLSGPGAGATVSDLALAGDGTTTVVWARAGVVQAATRPAGGAFGSPVDLSTAGQIPTLPQVAVAPDGTTTAVWGRVDVDNHTIVQATTRPPGGSFSPPVDLSAAGQTTYYADVAAAGDGTTVAVWTRSDGTHTLVQASTRLSGGAFGAPISLSAPGQNAFTPHVGLAANGFATVVWDRSDGISRTTEQATFTADAPIGRGALTISGTPALGSTLICDGGRWIGATSVETGWLRGEADIASGPDYTVAAADQGAALTCRGRASNALGTTSRLSSALTIPAAIPAPLPLQQPPGPAPLPADIRAPAVSVLTRTRITRKQFLRGVSVKLSTDEPATIIAELRGRASRSRTTGPYTRRLGSRTVFGVTRRIVTIKVKPRPAAVGNARSFPVRLRLTVTDALGNKRITGKTIRVGG